MKIASNEYKETLNKTSLSPKSKIVVDGKEYLGDVIKTPPKISHSNTSIAGGFPAKTLNVELYDFENNINLLNKEIIVYKGLLINGTIEYIKQGTFIARADDISTNITDKTISISKAQDKVQLFEGTYVSSLDWSNNKTHKGLEIVEEICNRLKIKLENKNFAFADYDFKQPNISSEITDRQMISSIACIGGEIAFLNANDNLTIKSQFITGDTISRKRYEKLSREKEVIINTVSIGNKDIDNDIIYPEEFTGDRVELKIEDNPFVDLYKEEMREEVAKHIIGVKYTPFVLDKIVDGYLYELNDVITVIDKNGEEFDAVILEIKDETRIKSTIKNEVLESKQTDYKLAGSKKQDLAEVKFLVDHNNKLIKGIAKEVTDTKEKVVEFEESLDGIKLSVEETNNKFDKEITSKKNAKGNPIEVTDAGEYPLESIMIEGKSYQEGTPTPTNPQEIKTVQGVTNLFDKNRKSSLNNFSSEILDNGIKIIQPNTTQWVANVYIVGSIKKLGLIGKKITIRANIKTSSTNKGQFLLGTCDKDCGNRVSFGSAALTSSGSKTVKLPEEITDTNEYLCYWLYANTDGIAKAEDYVEYTDVMIEEGTIAHNSVPYGRWLEQLDYSKNNAIFDESYKNSTYTYNEFREDSISVVKNGTGGTFYAQYKLDIREAGDYIISSESNVQHQLYVYTDALWGNLVKWVYTGKEQEITFSNVGTYVLGVFANSSTTGKEFQLNNLMVRKKEIEDSSYVKYEKNSALIDMNKDNKFDEELEIGNIDNGINLNATNTYRSKNYLKIKPNTIYSFYLNKKLHRVLISFYDKDKNYINTSAVGLETKGIINSMSNAEFLRFRCYGDDKSLFENSLIEIYEGIDRYYEFAQIDEVKDIFDNGKLTKNIEKYVVSSNVIGIQDTYTNVTYATIPKPINSANYGNYSNTSVLFTHATFKVKTWSSWDTLEMIGVISSNASSNEYWIGFPKGTTLDEMKTKLDDAVLYYRLKESQIYELPYERLKLHKGYNYITLNDELYSNMEIEYLTDSSLNAQYAKKSELEMTEESIRLDLSKKVSTDNFKTTIEEVNNTFEQKITDSEASTESLITRTKDDAIKTSKDYTDNKVKDRPTATEMTNQIKQSITDSENKTTSSLTSTFNNKLKDYSTTTQMNNAITQSQEATENKIAMEVSNTYETKEGATTKANNAKNEAIKNVDAKLELKVGNNEYNKIVSMLNAAADEINLKGGSKINITTAGKLIISAGNFQLDASGNIKATGGTIGGWSIDETSIYNDVKIGKSTYRGYIQSQLDDGVDSWAFSTQKDDGNGFYGTAGITYNGNVFCQKLEVYDLTYGNDKVIPAQWKQTISQTGTCQNNQNFDVNSIYLEKGYWTLQLRAWFSSNGSGIRGVGLTTGSNNFEQGNDRFTMVPGCSFTGIAQSIIYSVNIVVSTPTIYNLTLFQNSGSSLSCGGYIRAFRLK